MTEMQKSFYVRNAVIIKMSAIGVLILLMLIPVSMIRSLVMERSFRQKEATDEISSKWGNEQRLTGPILSVPYYSYDLNKDQKKVNLTRRYAHFLPENLLINGELNPEVRYRGIYKVAVYSSNLKLEGSFKFPKVEVPEKHFDIDWKNAFVTIGITDLRGIKESLVFKWNNTETSFEPGVRSIGVVESGVTVNIPLNPELTNSIDFNLDIVLNGSRSISFIPLGKVTSVNITSPWSNPSFDGAFLPESREISENGFAAQWKVLELNRNFPQHWIDNESNFRNSSFGVSLLLPIETYQITERSIKYAILFFALTFMVFFFVEVLRKIRVHPVQYVLVGFGLSLFYLLLLSLSEHIGFDLAYLVASIGIVALIATYSKGVFKNTKLTIMLASLMVVLYGFLYILLQMQDFALLLGSVGLFLVLALVMFISQKVDWYSLGEDRHS